jgi:hypothetical protein
MQLPPHDIYYHDKLMGKTYAQQDIGKIEVLREKVATEELHQAILVQIARYEKKLQEARDMRDKSGIAHYTAYLVTFKGAMQWS